MLCSQLLCLTVSLLGAGEGRAGGGAVDRLAAHHRWPGGQVHPQAEAVLDLLHPRGGVIVVDGAALATATPIHSGERGENWFTWFELSGTGGFRCTEFEAKTCS